MKGASREDAVAMLLQALPAELTERLMRQLRPAIADRLRARLRMSNGSNDISRLDGVLKELSDLRRIADRPAPPIPTAGEDSPSAMDKADPMRALRNQPPELLLAALRGEQPTTIAAVLSCLEPAAAAGMIKRLPPDVRSEAALRSGRPAPRNKALLDRLAVAVVEQCRASAGAEPEPTDDDRIRRLATLLRALGRSERVNIIQQLQESDPETADKVNEQLYQFDDILRVDNRALQSLLAELDMKTLALALHGADEPMRTKIQGNLSSRARDALAEEAGLVGNAAKAKVESARASVLAVLRRFEEEGKLNLEG